MDDLLLKATDKLAQTCSRRRFLSQAGKLALSLGLAAAGVPLIQATPAAAACEVPCNSCASFGYCYSPAPDCSTYGYTCPAYGFCPDGYTGQQVWYCCQSNHCLYRCL